MNDSPLFKNSAGTIKLSKLSTTTIRAGAQKQWKLPVKKKTKLKLKALIDYPLSSSSNNSDIEIASISGFSFFTNLKLSREILKKKNYSINAIWPIYFNYQSLTTKLTWGASDGSSKSTIWSAGTRLGLEIEF